MSVVAILMGAAAVQAAPSPSFACSAAKAPIEINICQDPKLAAADALMDQLFADAKLSAFGEGPSNQLAAQREWLKLRSVACTGLKQEEQAPCQLDFLNQRNEELAVAALYRNPAQSIAVLHQLDPEAAPLLEAVYMFSTDEPGTDWNSQSMATKRVRLLALLRPYAARFGEKDELSYGRNILEGDGIRSAEDALKTEKSFARFVQVASAYLGEGPVPRAMPCAALVRHPKLLEATGSVFGSTLDNFVLYPDCEETLPPTPRLSELLDRINTGWPECEGTIRFAYYRQFALAVTAARVATETDLNRRNIGGMPRRKGVSPAQVSAAVAELSDYYRRYRRASSANAPKLARHMVLAIMATGQQCSSD